MSDLTDREFWEELWPTLDPVRVVDEHFYFGSLLRRALGGGRTRTVVELGGFPGHVGVWCRKYLGLEPTLIDIFVDRPVLEDLLAVNGRPPDAIEAVEADLRDAPARRFDAVVSMGLLEHFTEPEAVLARHVDYLEPGGTLVVTVPNFLGLNGWLHRRYDPEHLAAHDLDVMRPGRLRELASGLGLAAWDVSYYGRYRVWLPRLGERPLRVRLLVYALQALGLPFAWLGLRGRWLTPHLALVGRAHDS